MEQRELPFSYLIHSDVSSVSNEDQDLITHAIKACDFAYVPYSAFRVGAAIRSGQGHIILGSNQENSAFPVGQCAERVALYRMVHEYGRIPIDTIAIAVLSEHEVKPTSPCGSCRQLLMEFRSQQDKPIRLLLTLAKGGEIIEIPDAKELLPLAFDGSFLGI